jgi:hypothetical protein
VRPPQGDLMSLWKNRPKSSPTRFCQKYYLLYTKEKKCPKIVGYFCHFSKTAQIKQSPIGRKLAQSGHPCPLPPFFPQHKLSLRDSLSRNPFPFSCSPPKVLSL